LPLKRDCGGTVPKPFSTVLGADVGRKYITRKERGRKMGVEAQGTEEEGQEGGGEVVAYNAADVYNIVSNGDAFDCPTNEQVERGLGDLWMMMEGEWTARNKGADVVWLNLPLPRVVVTEEELADFDIKKQRYWEENRISQALNLLKDVLTSAGVLVVVAPAGFPSEIPTGFSLGASAVAAEVRSVVTLIYDTKKHKVRKRSLLLKVFGRAGKIDCSEL
jgi:hypothetical protein